MLLGYVDESFSRDWYYMAALLCDGEGAQRIATALDQIVTKTVRDHGISVEAELHGYELFHGTKWWKGVPPRARIGVYSECLQVIGDSCEAVILRGVDSAGLRQRHANAASPHSVVLRHLLERINDYAKDRDTHVLIIADEVGEQAKHRSELATYMLSGTWGYRARILTQIVDTLHFAPSNASRLVQAIDLVVFLYRRMETHTEPSERAKRANARLWMPIEKRIHHQSCWYPMGSRRQMHEGPTRGGA